MAGLNVCTSVCGCAQGVPWEGSARVKIGLVCQTASFAAAEIHLPLIHCLCYTADSETAAWL